MIKPLVEVIRHSPLLWMLVFDLDGHEQRCRLHQFQLPMEQDTRRDPIAARYLRQGGSRPRLSSTIRRLSASLNVHRWPSRAGGTIGSGRSLVI